MEIRWGGKFQSFQYSSPNLPMHHWTISTHGCNKNKTGEQVHAMLLLILNQPSDYSAENDPGNVWKQNLKAQVLQKEDVWVKWFWEEQGVIWDWDLKDLCCLSFCYCKSRLIPQHSLCSFYQCCKKTNKKQISIKNFWFKNVCTFRKCISFDLVCIMFLSI